MKYAEDFRRIARLSLKGKWALAVAVGLVASILGGIGESYFNIEFNTTTANGLLTRFTAIDSKLFAILSSAIFVIALIALAMGIAYFILSSFIAVGYAKFNLDLVDNKEAGFNSLFDYYRYWKTTAISRLLRAVYIFLWTLILFIPGIIATYSYAMTDYILAENPTMSPTEAINKSKEIMYGNRWRLFCLEFSFIGWAILAVLTCNIGTLWLTPYRSAAKAAFYREVSGTECFIYADPV